MSTISNSSPATTIDRLGGEPVIIKVTWTLAEMQAQSFFGPTDSFKMVVRKESDTVPGTYVDIGVGGAALYCYSGTPEQGGVLYHYDPAQSRVLAWKNVIPTVNPPAYINAPVYQFVKGYMPKLLAGVYYVQLQNDTGGGVYADFGTPVAMWCQEPSRFDTVYSLKSNYDEKPYLVGAQDISQGGV